MHIHIDLHILVFINENI